MTTVSLELPLRTIEPAADGLTVGMSWRSHRDEDRLLVDPSAALYGVFDGAGGHGDGAAAASAAAEAVNRRVRAGLPGCRDLEAIQNLLDLALADADAAVAALDAGRENSATSPSATTATIALICRRPADTSRLVAVIANLGDSRAQLMHGGRLQTVTLDHSYLSEPDPMEARARQDRLDAAQQLTDLDDPMDRAAFAHRHLLANALTGSGLQDVRHYLVDLLPGDRLVLDSDGIHDNLTTAELEAVLSGSGSAPEAAEHAVASAWSRSEEDSDDLGRAKPDDMTILVLDVRELGQQQSATGTYRLPPGGEVSLSLSPATKQYLVSAADLQVLVAQRDGAWWATQPHAAPGESGSWQLRPGQPLEFGRYEPGGFRTEPSDQVSRRHMVLSLSEAADLLTVSDLNSTNGTAVLGW
ncbi:MAG TPA: protein phosphatase 2C domain-containing protein [Frankiaceae bacterium]|jgi:serine/threonine protein phosphatase PrpC|nr:protein phosphatase 2C domain-containing protein [Frankiaceae bacterium]